MRLADRNPKAPFDIFDPLNLVPMSDLTVSTIPQRLGAEALGTALLLMAVVGSGIMGERLDGGSVGLALLCNTLATGAALVVLILVFGPISGAHFNPAVTAVALIRKDLQVGTAALYILAQIVGAILGVYAAHLMFSEAVIQVSVKLRDGPAQMFSEFIATFGLIATILGTQRARLEITAVTVGLYITSAYWFTSSTSFANPAVTIARSLSNTFVGIAPSSAPPFIFAQLVGALTATFVMGALLAPRDRSSPPS